jgi:hypothetical protein
MWSLQEALHGRRNHKGKHEPGGVSKRRYMEDETTKESTKHVESARGVMWKTKPQRKARSVKVLAG